MQNAETLSSVLAVEQMVTLMTLETSPATTCGTVSDDHQRARVHEQRGDNRKDPIARIGRRSSGFSGLGDDAGIAALEGNI